MFLYLWCGITVFKIWLPNFVTSDYLPISIKYIFEVQKTKLRFAWLSRKRIILHPFDFYAFLSFTLIYTKCSLSQYMGPQSWASVHCHAGFLHYISLPIAGYRTNKPKHKVLCENFKANKSRGIVDTKDIHLICKCIMRVVRVKFEL